MAKIYLKKVADPDYFEGDFCELCDLNNNDKLCDKVYKICQKEKITFKDITNHVTSNKKQKSLWQNPNDQLPEKERIDGFVAIYPVIKLKDKKLTFCRFYSNYWKTDTHAFVNIGNKKITEVLKWYDITKIKEEK